MKRIRDIFLRFFVKFFVRSPLNVRLGRIFYGNDGGIYSNLIGEYILYRDRTKAENKGFIVNQTNVSSASINSEGFIINDSLVGSELIESIAEKWNIYCKDKTRPKDGRLQISSKEDSSIMHSYFSNVGLCITAEIQEIIEQFYRCHMNILNYHIYRIYGYPDKTNQLLYGSTATWHNDGSTSESLKLFYMLSDINEIEDGPTAVLNIEQTKKVTKSGKFYFPDKQARTAKLIQSEYKPELILGAQGTAFIVRTNQCLHSASIPNQGRTRDLLAFYITSSAKKRMVSEQLNNAQYGEILGLKRFSFQ
jgi:hypothetical protein